MHYAESKRISFFLTDDRPVCYIKYFISIMFLNPSSKAHFIYPCYFVVTFGLREGGWNVQVVETTKISVITVFL
jgi:hypothetical protein